MAVEAEEREQDVSEDAAGYCEAPHPGVSRVACEGRPQLLEALLDFEPPHLRGCEQRVS